MQDREAIIKKIQSLPDEELKKISEYIALIDEKKIARKRKPDALSDVIGICEGPIDLAEKHDSYVY